MALPNVWFSKGTLLDLGVSDGDRDAERAFSRPARVPDAAGVERLYRAQRLNMVRLALSLVDDRGTAEDVAPGAFAAVHRRWEATPVVQRSE